MRSARLPVLSAGADILLKEKVSGAGRLLAGRT